MNVPLMILLLLVFRGLAFAQEPKADLLQAPPALDPSTNKSRVSTNAPYKTPPNRIIEFSVPLSQSAKLSVANSRNPAVETARAAIAVPLGFDPEVPTPILLVCGSSDGDGSSIR